MLSHWLSTATWLPFVRRLDRNEPTHVPQHSGLRPYSTSIHTLDDDSLLKIFYLYRPVLLDEDEVGDIRILQGGMWDRERWWYKIAHVCRRWRYLILGSVSHLGLSLLCTYGTPVADMLAHSPSLPLTIDHVRGYPKTTTEDEEDILLALQNRERVRRIRLLVPIPNLQKLIMAMDEEFPMLEYLYIAPPIKDNTSLIFPISFQAPHLRHLILIGFDFPIRSPLLTSAVGLRTLTLEEIHPSIHFCPNDLLQPLSLMPQLETLIISFHSPVPNRDVQRQLLQTPIMTHVTLPYLRWFAFSGVSAYLESVLPRMTTPLLERLRITFFNQLTYSVPHLLQFMITTENLRFSIATFGFYDWGVLVRVDPYEGARTYALHMEITCIPFDWQVASAAQIFYELGTVFSAVEYLTLEYSGAFMPSSGADRGQWRKLLRSFRNVKTLRVGNKLTGELSHSLKLDDGESPMDLLPELKGLVCSAGGDFDNPFTTFINARQVVGHPVALVHG